ncbi:hypothetical protein [Halopseudomonas maritima]|uniref:hypothetical protein n=1 Tax=Halopseudomonas maritima TaxID=2918528 RepID=UPI001EEAFAD5|nr:hypothetical protein [Halopseudomonas maritima]UJJ31481.1 hypothetical protein HV822_17335 [Halopseudomonas maritima]
MDARSLILSLSCLVLALTMLVYGILFIRRHRNYLLGVEWLIVAVSATNMLLFQAVGYPLGYEISMFLDAFSRGFGIPIITILGLMVVTRGFKPSALVDVLVFAISIPATFLLRLDVFAGVLPYFYVLMALLFAAYLIHFARLLLAHGERTQAVSVLLAMTGMLAIALIYDFYEIPGEATNVVLNFFNLALLTWSYLFASLYHAYSALACAKARAAPVS